MARSSNQPSPEIINNINPQSTISRDEFFQLMSGVEFGVNTKRFPSFRFSLNDENVSTIYAPNVGEQNDTWQILSHLQI